MNPHKKKIVFIINPISGTQNKEQITSSLDEILDKDKFDWEIVKTERAGHASEIAATAARDGIDIVGAIGGDGTINEIGRSLVHTSTAMAIIPSGSGNGLARHLEIPMEPKKAIEMINNGVVSAIDYGKINNIPFFCVCGLGFDAFVSLKFAESGKRGPITYLEKTLTESLKYQPETYELETEDGTVKHKAFLIACANASQYGNNAYIAPQATTTDGLMDVIILEPFTVLDVPALSFQLFNKTIDQNSHIKTFRCKKLRIKRKSKGVVHFDGDPVITKKNVDVEMIPKSLNVIVPPSVDKGQTTIYQKLSDYFTELKMINDAIVGDISQRNKSIMNKNKAFIKKLTKKD